MDKETSGSLRRRIRAGEVRRQDVIRRLAELAFGSVGDCARLVMEENVDIGRLDLSLLSEIRRTDKGIEVKLLDRLKVLEQLAALTEGSGDSFEELLRSLGEGEV